MKLSDLSIDQQNDPHELAAFFAENPGELLDYDTCKQLHGWIRDKHPAVKYALSSLKSLTDFHEKKVYLTAVPLFIMNESDFQFDDLPEWLIEHGYDLDDFHSYLRDTDTQFNLGDDADEVQMKSVLGALNAIQFVNHPEDKLHPFLYAIYPTEVVSDNPGNKEYSQAAIVKEYWRYNAYGQTPSKQRYRDLLEQFRDIPALPEKKKEIPISAKLSSSLIKSGLIQGVDKSTQCDLTHGGEDKAAFDPHIRMEKEIILRP